VIEGFVFWVGCIVLFGDVGGDFVVDFVLDVFVVWCGESLYLYCGVVEDDEYVGDLFV